MKNLMKLTMALALVFFAVSANAQDRPQGQRGERPSTEQMVKQQVDQMTKDLKLTKDQEKQVSEILTKSYEKRAEQPRQNIRDMSQSDREAAMSKMREEMEKQGKELSAEMKKVLTADQFTKWEKAQKERMARMQQGQGQRQGGPRN